MKCVKCGKDFKPNPDTPREHKGFCPYCCIRYEMAAMAKLSGKSKKEVKKYLELTDEQIDEGMERIVRVMRSAMYSFKEVANAMCTMFQQVGGILRKFKEDNQ